MVSDNWEKVKITSVEQLEKLWNKSKTKLDVSIDTETDGLFLMTAKPFLIIFGWTPGDFLTTGQIVTVFEPTPELIATMYKMCGTVETGFMHNAKFDLHMLTNGYKAYPHRNFYDTMTMARLTLEAVNVDKGGPSLALKDLATKYIEKSGKEEQNEIKRIKGLIGRERAAQLNAAIASLGYGVKEWNKVKLEKIAADPILEIDKEVPEDVRKYWYAWIKKYPATKGLRKVERVTYKDIYEYSKESKEAMIKYAFKDVIYTTILGRKFLPFIDKMKSRAILDQERAAMYALYETERVGLKIDLDYIKKAKEAMRNEIIRLRKIIQSCIGDEYEAATFSSSPKQIKDWLLQNNVVSTSTNQATLETLVKTEDDDTVVKTLSAVLEHRSFLKKYSTDLLGYETNEYKGRRYTSYNQNKAVTGRISNDMQQMANEGITNDKGEELFHPRKAVIPTGGDYPKILYIDYSQVEVRIQAHYTWLAMKGTGDTNLLRMYVPFNCYSITKVEEVSPFEPPIIVEVKTKWDPKDPTNTKQQFIESKEWFQIEDDKPWIKTDMHLLTARQAFSHELNGLPDTDKLVQKRRKQAKSINFAIQYGAGEKRVMEMAETPEIGKALYKANKEKFPGFDAYAKMLRSWYNRDGYVENAYHRKYITKYFTHKFGNYVIQGSGASLLKEKLAECSDYLKDKKSRAIHNIHDEIQFEVHKDEDFVIKELQKIMSNTGDKFIVPILADLEIATTNWKEKYEIR